MLVTLLALVCRLVFLLAQGIDAPPVDWGDDHEYHRIALQLVSEGSYENLWFPPGYPLFLSAIYALFGPQLIVVRLLQALLGAATCTLTYLIGRRVFDARIGLLAAALLAVYPGHLFMSWRVMAESLYIFLIALGVLLALRVLERPRVPDAVGLAVALGAASAVKSNLILFPPLVLAWVAYNVFRRRPGGPAAVGALLFAFVLASLATPTANLIASQGRFGLLAGNAGHTLWFSNNPAADGYFVDPQDDPRAQRFVERHGMSEALSHADEFESEPLYRDLALLWIRENPWEFAKLCGKKLTNAFGVLPRAAVFDGYPLAKWVHLASYGVLLPFMLAGLVLSRRRCRQAMILYLALATYVVMVLVYYGTPRFTVIIVPYLLIFAAAALAAAQGALATFLSRRRDPARIR